LRSCRTYAPASDRSSRSLHIPTIAFIACLRLVCEAPYLSLTAMRTSSEIDVRRCRDWICNAFQISSSRYSCVRFMMYSIHHRFRKTSLTIAAIASSGATQSQAEKSVTSWCDSKWSLFESHELENRKTRSPITYAKTTIANWFENLSGLQQCQLRLSSHSPLPSAVAI
jgi:hypothetical protein